MQTDTFWKYKENYVKLIFNKEIEREKSSKGYVFFFKFICMKV